MYHRLGGLFFVVDFVDVQLYNLKTTSKWQDLVILVSLFFVSSTSHGFDWTNKSMSTWSAILSSQSQKKIQLCKPPRWPPIPPKKIQRSSQRPQPKTKTSFRSLKGHPQFEAYAQYLEEATLFFWVQKDEDGSMMGDDLA